MKIKSRVLCAVLAAVMCLSLGTTAFAAGSAYDNGNKKLVALTFDDGPGPYSQQILDTLESRGAKATFFMNGYLIKKYPDAVKRMAEDGFQIANHTYNHAYLTKISDKQIKTEISSTSELLTKLTGQKGNGSTGFYLRPPYGAFNKDVIAAAGVPVIWCTVDSGDWKYDDAQRLVSYTSSTVKDGDIVIMHESHKSTAEGLGKLVDKLQSMGYELVTVQELFWRRGITPQAGKIYYSAPNKGTNRVASQLFFDETKLSSHWAADAINFVSDKGYMENNQYGEFTPNFALTRGDFAIALGRMTGAGKAAGKTGYTDVADSSALAPYVIWARENGIMDGVGSGKFDPEGTLTRQQLATVLKRYMSFKGLDTKTDAKLTYSDAGSIADWAKDGVAYCTDTGLLKGDNGAFLPAGITTRAMGATAIERLAEYNFDANASSKVPKI